MRKLIKYLPVYTLSVFPFWLLFALSDGCFFILYYVVGYRKEIVRKNLLSSFPEKSAAEIRKIEKDFYRHFTDLIFETAKLITISEQNIKKRFQVVNPELLEKYYKQQRSVIMYTAHQGNWEWLAALPLFLSHQVTTFYQPLASAFFEELMKDSRERFGLIAVPSGHGYKRLIDFAAKGVPTATCMIGDQSPKKKSSRHWVRFLNQDTAFLIGADRIARKLNQPVVFPLMKKVGRGRYIVEMLLLTEDPQGLSAEQIIESYARELEKMIMEQPFMWLWSHKRWKAKKNQPNDGHGTLVPPIPSTIG